MLVQMHYHLEMKFLHSADWQLGKPFGRFEADVRAALTEARFDVIDTLGKAAADHGVQHILVAGDIFDTEGPEDRAIVQAVSRMSRYRAKWWLLPGNHDFSRNGGLWDRVRQKAGDRIVVLSEPSPHEIDPGAWVLPAPLIHRHNLEDPTALFDSMDTPGARLRIGLAHGSVRDFGTQGETRNRIAPHRAKLSKLDYLALGDWHGTLKVDSRTWYAGTPETDRFQRDDPGHVLLVELHSDREPTVLPLRTGRYRWLRREWLVNDRAAFDAECDQLLAAVEPSATLVQLTLAGITSLTERIGMLLHLEDDLRHRLRHLDVRAENLVGRPTGNDLASLEVEGILGAAAKKLAVRIEAEGADAAIAKRALERLFVEYSREEPA